LLWPVPLSFIYPRWQIQPHQFTQWGAFIGTLVICSVLLAYRKRLWARAILLGSGYFALMLAPVLGLANVYFFRYSFVSDHFCYLASIGLIALATAAVARAVTSRQMQVALAAAGILAFGALTWQRIPVFRNDAALWRDTLEKNPDAAIAHNNLGNIYRRRGLFAEAEAHYREALRLTPNYPEVYNNLGIALAELKRWDEAEKAFGTAIQLRPTFADAHDNLDHLHQLQKPPAAP